MSNLKRELGIDAETAEKLQDAGCKDLLSVATMSPKEIARETETGEDQAEEIRDRAYERADFEGFKTASEMEEPPDFRDYDPPEEVEGWTRITLIGGRIAWATPSGYKVTLGGHGPEVGGPLPPAGEPGEEYNPQQTKTRERTLKSEFEDPAEAIGYAIGWMEAHPVDFEDDLTEFSGISKRTAEYLLFKHGVDNHQKLYELHKDSVLSEIVGTQFLDDIDAEMDEMFGGAL